MLLNYRPSSSGAANEPEPEDLLPPEVLFETSLAQEEQGNEEEQDAKGQNQADEDEVSSQQTNTWPPPTNLLPEISVRPEGEVGSWDHLIAKREAASTSKVVQVL